MSATPRPVLRHLAAAAVTAVVATCATTAVEAVDATAAAAAETHAASYLHALNQERAAHGLAPLTPRADLNAVARRWAHRMASTHALWHNPRLTEDVRNWQVVGENVGEGPSVSDLTDAFWASPEHRANILTRNYRDVGVGAVSRGGVIWITVDFRAPLHAEPAPAQHVSTHRHASHSTTRHATSSGHRATARHHHARHRTLRYGMTGRDVARIQRRLGVSADGIFGPITRHAVGRFQRRHGLHASGVVGRRTWRAITR